MRFLHAMVRVYDLDAALDFFCAGLGLREARRRHHPEGRSGGGTPVPNGGHDEGGGVGKQQPGLRIVQHRCKLFGRGRRRQRGHPPAGAPGRSG